MLISRRSLMTAAASLTAGAGLSPLARALPGHLRQRAGINLAGAEFGRVPGVMGTDYGYPGPVHMDYFATAGLDLVRLPFRWERLQPCLFGAFDVAERARLEACVRSARARGLTVVIDPHNYGRRYLAEDGWNREHLIGSSAVPVAAFADFWARLAVLHRDDGEVWLGLMNEPYDMPVAQWLEAAQAALTAIRGAGARSLVLVPGTNWSGAHSWLASGNDRMALIRDPANTIAIEVHQYFDADSSGSSPIAVSATIGSERITEFQDWARRTGMRAFLGEFGFADTPRMLAAGRDLLASLARAPDVWIGWAAWAAGPRWPEDAIYLLEPRPDGSMRPQTQVLVEAAAWLRLPSGRGR
ncbi:MAG: glycoside hydrolase family 5 protein [Hyphomicrobiaceae bacterium]|nr:glycoside hydrolase family 5 protein [Hyphomicrobiaceae bacterium]